MFVLAKKQLIRGSAAHIKAGLGAGMDYRANFVPLFMPFDGKIDKIYSGTEGGKWLDIVDPHGVRLQFAHLDRYNVKAGEFAKQGRQIALTGNTGSITSGPHLHIQGIKNGKRVWLDNYNWDEFNTPPPTPPNGGTMSDEDKAHMIYDYLYRFMTGQLRNDDGIWPEDLTAYQYIGVVAKRDGKSWQDSVLTAFREQYAREIKDMRKLDCTSSDQFVAVDTLYRKV